MAANLVTTEAHILPDLFWDEGQPAGGASRLTPQLHELNSIPSLMTKTDDLLFKLLLAVIFAGLFMAFANSGRAASPKLAGAATPVAHYASAGQTVAMTSP